MSTDAGYSGWLDNRRDIIEFLAIIFPVPSDSQEATPHLLGFPAREKKMAPPTESMRPSVALLAMAACRRMQLWTSDLFHIQGARGCVASGVIHHVDVVRSPHLPACNCTGDEPGLWLGSLHFL